MKTRIIKTENHVTLFTNEIDTDLALALGYMVVAFGRLEDMFKIGIKRIEQRETLEEVIRRFSGQAGTLGNLLTYCRDHCPILTPCCSKAAELNGCRQEFIHATFSITEEGRYVRFRNLNGYVSLQADLERLYQIIERVNSLISDLDQMTGAILSNQSGQSEIIVSAPGFQQ